jgi:SAM-dependent methyltransferase
MSAAILEQVKRYYDRRLADHGTTPAGVDWNSAESQELRFTQLMKIRPGGLFSLLDYGCGYGALLDWLLREQIVCPYTGYDVSESMVATAGRLHGAVSDCRFTVDLETLEPADVVVASGIFNVKQDESVDRWQAYILDTLEHLNRLGTQGFAFNLLTSYSDPDRMRPTLYYGDPCFYFDLCKRRYGRDVALLHDYGLYEFTLLVRKRG